MHEPLNSVEEPHHLLCEKNQMYQMQNVQTYDDFYTCILVLCYFARNDFQSGMSCCETPAPQTDEMRYPSKIHTSMLPSYRVLYLSSCFLIPTLYTCRFEAMTNLQKVWIHILQTHYEIRGKVHICGSIIWPTTYEKEKKKSNPHLATKAH